MASQSAAMCDTNYSVGASTPPGDSHDLHRCQTPALRASHHTIGHHTKDTFMQSKHNTLAPAQLIDAY